MCSANNCCKDNVNRDFSIIFLHYNSGVTTSVDTALTLARCRCVVPVYGGRRLPLHGAGVLSQSMEDGAYPCTVPVCCPSLWRTALTLARCRCVLSQSMEDGSYPCTVPVCCPSLWRTALTLARCRCVVPVYGGRLLPLHGAGVLSQSMEDGSPAVLTETHSTLSESPLGSRKPSSHS